MNDVIIEQRRQGMRIHIWGPISYPGSDIISGVRYHIRGPISYPGSDFLSGVRFSRYVGSILNLYIAMYDRRALNYLVQEGSNLYIAMYDRRALGMHVVHCFAGLSKKYQHLYTNTYIAMTTKKKKEIVTS